jgi:DhnA family fructose-bisphosphate aldolase class Ia
MIGKIIRLNKILDKNGKTIITPFDHGIEGYYRELEDPIKLIEEVIKGGADALLLRRGLISKIARSNIIQKVGIVYRLSAATGTSPDVYDQRKVSSLQTALKLGADAVVFTVVVGHPKENDMITTFGEISDQAYEFGIPLIGEIDVWPNASGNKGELIRQGVRALSEENADIIKSYFPEEESYYSNIVKYSLAPLVAAGGPKMENPTRVLEFTKKIMNAGCIGVAFGRNVWQYNSPSKMVRALSAIIKEGKEVNEAKQLL